MADPQAAADAPAAAPRRRWRRIALAAGAAVLVLAGVLVACLPAILSSGAVRRMAEREASAAAGMRVEIGALSVGWSAIEARDVAVRYGPGSGDPLLLTAETVHVDAGIPLAFRSRMDVPLVRLVRPEVRLDLGAILNPPAPPSKSPAAGTAGAGGAERGGGQEPLMTPFSVKARMEEGTLIQVGLDGKETRLGTFSGDAAAASDAAATADLALDLGAGGRIAVHATAEPFREGRPVPSDAVVGEIRTALEAVDLARLREALCALGEVRFDRVEGLATGTISSFTTALETFDGGRASLRVRGLALAGPELGDGILLQEPECGLDAGFSIAKDGAIEFRDYVATAPGLEARGRRLAVSAENVLDGDLLAKGAVDGLVARLARCGLRPSGTFGGEFGADLRLSGDATTQRASARVEATALSISPGDGAAGVREPSLKAAADVTLGTGGSLRVEKGVVRCGTADLEGIALSWNGGLRRARATGSLHLERLAPFASALGLALPADLAGTADLDVDWPEAAGATAKGTVLLRDLALTPPGEGRARLREPLLAIAFEAVPGEKEAEVRSFEMKGEGLALRASGRVAPDLSTGSLASVEADLQLERVAALADAFGAALPVRLKGAASWKGPASWKDGFDSVSAGEGTLAVRGLEVASTGPDAGPPWTEKEISGKATASWDRRTGSARGEAVLRSDDGTATVKGGIATANGVRSCDATADLDLDLSGLCRARPDLVPIAGMVVGRVKGTAEVRGPLPSPLDAAGLRGVATLDVDRVKTDPLDLRDAHLDATLADGTVTASTLTAVVNDGTLQATAALGLSGDSPAHFLDLHASRVRIDRAMSCLLKSVVPLFAVGDAGSLGGLLRMDLRLDGTGASWDEVKPNLRGKGVLEVSEGSVLGNGIGGEILDFFGKGGGLKFATVSTDFSVHDQRVWNERLAMDGKETSLLLRGSTGFDGRLDYRVGARMGFLGKKRLERLKALADDDGTIPFGIGGTLSKPKLKPPDLKKLLGNSAEDLLKKKLKELLGGSDE